MQSPLAVLLVDMLVHMTSNLTQKLIRCLVAMFFFQLLGETHGVQ